MSAPAQERRHARFGPFEVDLQSGELRTNGHRIKLQEKPFQILAVLLDRPGEVVTREEIRHKLWPADTFVDFEHGINVAVKKLREALDDDAENPRFIETLPRHGYRFIAPVYSQGLAPQRGQESTVTNRRGNAGTVRQPWLRAGRVTFLAAGTIVVLLGAIVALNVTGLRDRGARIVGKMHESPPQIRSIAVLPLENLSRDPEQEYFAEGLTDALITNLGKVATLRVISRTSVMRYKNSKKSLPEIAGELNVDAVVEGTVQRTGNLVRISAQLIDARTDRHLWAETYERDGQDPLVLEEKAALAIACEVSGRLTTDLETRLVSRRGANPQAYDAYLRGRYLWNKRSADKSVGARVYFEQATREDPNFALAYSGLADYFSTSWATWTDQTLAEKYARKAVALEPDLAEGHASLGLIAVYESKFPEAERELKRAIELNPSYSMAHHWYSLCLQSLGRPSEALAENDRARQLDPFSLPINFFRGGILFALREYDQAVAEEETAVAIDPQEPNPHITLASIYWFTGNISKALAEERQALTLAHVSGRLAELDEIAAVYAQSGRHAALLKAARVKEKGYCGNPLNRTAQRPDCYSAYEVAYQFGLLGDKERTLRWLERAVRDGPLWSFSSAAPELDCVRSDPRFRELLRRANRPL